MVRFSIIKWSIFHLTNTVPTGNKSHQELLHQMASKNSTRMEIINEDMYLKLREYATFRHFYRHTYSFQLNWAKMEPLVNNLYYIWTKIKLDLEKFID